MYREARVLVAGGTGTIGVQVVKKLIQRGAKVSVVAQESKKKFIEIFGEQSNIIQYKNLDLTSEKSCKFAVKNQDFVINLVGIKGSTGIGESRVASYLIPMLRFQTNLMEAAFNEGISRFLFTGSICSYPQSDIHFEENMWNGMPKQNDRIPGIAKRVGELLGEALELEYGWDAVRVVRPANVYGPFDDFNPKSAQVIPALIHKAHSGVGQMEVWGDGSAIRDFIYSEDVAYWVLEALEKAPSNYPINLGSGKGVTIREVANTIIKIINPNIEIKWNLQGPTGDPVRILSIERARKILGYTPLTELSEGLTKVIDWYKQKKFIF